MLSIFPLGVYRDRKNLLSHSGKSEDPVTIINLLSRFYWFAGRPTAGLASVNCR